MKASEGDFPILCPRIKIDRDSMNVTAWSPGHGLGSLLIMREQAKGPYQVYLQFLRIFSRELGYPWPGPGAESLGVGQLVYLIFQTVGNKPGVDPKLDTIAIGFVRMTPDTQRPGLERLEDCWIHPAFRGRGILTAMWPHLKSIHGDFMVKPPHSHSMVGFMNKLKIDWAGAARAGDPKIVPHASHKGKQDIASNVIDKIVSP